MPRGAAPGPQTFDEVGYPLPERFVEAAGARICYVDAGEGPPVCFLPPAGRGLIHYAANLEAFAARGFRVLALDPPGTAKSSKGERDYTVDDHLGVLVEFLDAIGLREPATFVGTSFGGLLAARLAAERPSRVRALVLVGAAGHAVPLARRTAIALTINEPILSCLGRRGWRAVARRAFHGEHPSVEASADLAANLAGTPPFLAYIRAFVRTSRSALAARILGVAPRIRAPTLLVWGERDFVFPPALARGLAAAIPGARLVILPGVGHYANVEGRDAFHREALAFVEEATARTG